MATGQGATKTARDYYNSEDADLFYAQVWGGVSGSSAMWGRALASGVYFYRIQPGDKCLHMTRLRRYGRKQGVRLA